MKANALGVWCAGLVAGAVLMVAATTSFAQDATVVRASVQAPAASSFTKAGFDWILDEIEAATEGRVSFERYYSGSIASAPEQLQATGSGLAGVALVVPTYTPGLLPLANVASNPAIWRDSWTGSMAYKAIYDEFPEMNAELEKNGVVLISALALPSYNIFARDIDLSNLDQVDGLKVMGSGQIAVMLSNVGARITAIPTPEGYEAMQRGTVDAAVYGLSAAATYGIPEVSQSLWRLPVGGLPVLVVMNKRVWDGISPEDQTLIREAAAGHAEAMHRIYQIEGDGTAIGQIKEAGLKIIEPDAAALEALTNAASSTWDQWRNEHQQGAILDRFIELVAEFDQTSPFASK